MELKKYFRILTENWWAALPAFLITFAAAVLFTLNQTSIYSSSATFVITLNTEFGDAQSFVSGLESLSRRTEIATTYAEIASSRHVKNAVSDDLALSRAQRSQVAVSSQLLAGTNVLKIMVEAADPVLARDLTQAIGEETIQYARSLYEPVAIRPLDEATLNSSPLRPAKKFNIMLGGILGLGLAVGVAFAAHYMREPQDSIIEVSITDGETGAYNRQYFLQRLGTEMARSRRQSYALSIALLNVDHIGTLRAARSAEARTEMLRKVGIFLKQYLRDEDLVAYLGQGIFALMLPDLPEEEAKATTDRLQKRIAWTAIELEKTGATVNLTSTVGVAGYEDNKQSRDELVAKAGRALASSGGHDYSKTFLATEYPDSAAEKPAFATERVAGIGETGSEL
jgi:diguanylate cyclase (GGDEF)-like protein